MNLYVGNLNYDMSEEDLRTAFAEHGDVTSAKIITDKFTGRSRGFGFVEMGSDDAGKAAMENLNGKDLGGRPIIKKKTRPRR